MGCSLEGTVYPSAPDRAAMPTSSSTIFDAVFSAPMHPADLPRPISFAETRGRGRTAVQRICQQEILAELGVVALQARPFPELLNETVRLTAEGMQAEFCKVLEPIPKVVEFG